MTKQNQIINVIKRIKEQAPNGFSENELVKIKHIVNKLLLHKDGLMAVISISKSCPEAVDINVLIKSCQIHNPMLLDELMDLSGIDKVTLQEKIVRSLQIGQAMGRVQIWYPDDIWPSILQETLINKIYNKAISEMTDGQAHKRELMPDTGELVAAAIRKVGTSFTEPTCVFKLLRVGHYVLRGINRAQEMHHNLDDNFKEQVLSAAWSYAKSQESLPSLVNAAALTLSNKEVFPDALNYIKMNYPEFTDIVSKGWLLENKELTKYIGLLRKDASMKSTVITRGARVEEDSLEF